jgi:hypothetical protein
MPKRFEAGEGNSRRSMKTPTHRRRIVGYTDINFCLHRGGKRPGGTPASSGQSEPRPLAALSHSKSSELTQAVVAWVYLKRHPWSVCTRPSDSSAHFGFRKAGPILWCFDRELFAPCGTGVACERTSYRGR